MRKLVLITTVLAVGALTPQLGQAQVQIGPTLAFHDDFDLGVGATLTAQAPTLGQGVGFLGEFLVFFPDPDAVDYFEINGNITYEFILENSTIRPFVLGGLNVARVSVDSDVLDDRSNTEIGLNVGGGIAFDAGSVRPLVGGRFELDGGDGFVVFFTLPFEVAGR